MVGQLLVNLDCIRVGEKNYCKFKPESGQGVCVFDIRISFLFVIGSQDTETHRRIVKIISVIIVSRPPQPPLTS